MFQYFEKDHAYVLKKVAMSMKVWKHKYKRLIAFKHCIIMVSYFEVLEHRNFTKHFMIVCIGLKI